MTDQERIPQRDVKRFWEKVKIGPADDCWIWQGKPVGGYGRITIGGSVIRAHRLSWQLAHGPIPEGMLVCHNCPGGDNPLCVNPAHLFLGTNADNTADKIAKGRARYAQGSRVSGAKLTEADVLVIRDLRADGHTYQRIAARFRVSERAISRITRGEGWGHVD